MPAPIKAPFPWFGGKTRCADLIWERFGNTPNYIEPFAGSLAVLLARPHAPRLETVNDRDAFLANFWRAVKRDPEAVAHYADWPINECDLHARHRWLVAQDGFLEKMRADPEHFDAKIAGWWVWGISMWIGSGWCERPDWEGRGHAGRAPRGPNWAVKPHVANGGMGVHAKKPHFRGVKGVAFDRPVEKRPHINSRSEGGLHAKRPAIGGKYKAPGIVNPDARIVDWMFALAERLRYVRVCCGDWKRVVTPSVTYKISGDKMPSAIFLDPPYDLDVVRNHGDGHAPTDKLYTHHDRGVSAEVREWAIENGENPLLRIALCGYDGEHEMPNTWECVHWKANGGYANQKRGLGKDNAKRERIWFSPACLRQGLFV